MIGSLLLGVYDDGRLRYAGHVGTGFTQAMLADLMRQLRRWSANQPVRHAGPGPACPRRALGGTAAGRRGGVRRVDQRREHAPPELARSADRQGPPGRAPRHRVRDQEGPDGVTQCGMPMTL